MQQLRLTKIVCTIGPASWDIPVFTALGEKGMNVARLNFSHGERPLHQKLIDTVNAYNRKHDLQVAIMLDTRGAEIRTGDVQDPIMIAKGEEVIFATKTPAGETRKVIEVSYDHFAKDVTETKIILIDNGELSFDIVNVEANGSVLARARESGKIGTRRHINLPGADIDLPSITDKDWEDIEFGAAQNLDFIALSFIRNADEVREVRALLQKLSSTTQIISKIETRQGVAAIAEIIEVSDGIMVARGDLGAEVPFEQLPIIQDEIVCRCKDEGKPVIIATHMLESMCYHPIPTRAEVTDTSHAVVTGADATMLSGETASGGRPVEAYEAMDRIERAMETHMAKLENIYEIRFKSSAEEEMDSAVTFAEAHNASAFVVITESGRTARHISKFRPSIPIIALTPSDTVQRSLLLSFGVHPVTVDFGTSDDETMKKGLKKAKELGLLKKGDQVVLLKNRAKSPEMHTV